MTTAHLTGGDPNNGRSLYASEREAWCPTLPLPIGTSVTIGALGLGPLVAGYLAQWDLGGI